jgi:hypothetical protein
MFTRPHDNFPPDRNYEFLHGAGWRWGRCSPRVSSRGCNRAFPSSDHNAFGGNMGVLHSGDTPTCEGLPPCQTPRFAERTFGFFRGSRGRCRLPRQL